MPAVAALTDRLAPGWRISRAKAVRLTAAQGLLLLVLAACASTPERPIFSPGPGNKTMPRTEPPPTSPTLQLDTLKPLAELPGWADDDHVRALAAFRTGCRAVRDPTLQRTCQAADRTGSTDEDSARRFFEHHFRAVAVPGEGVLTGYFAPVYPASRSRSAPFTAPVRPLPSPSAMIYRQPPAVAVVPQDPGATVAPPKPAPSPTVGSTDPLGDLLSDAPTNPVPSDAGRALATDKSTLPATVRPEPDVSALTAPVEAPASPAPLPPVRLRDAERALIDTAPADDSAAWMRPEDLFFMQIQGSGILYFPDGARLRAAYSGDNGQPFVGIAKVMLQQRLLPNTGTSGDAIRRWLADHAGVEAQAVMNRNPRYVFFRLGPDSGAEPMGAAGIPLPAGRAIAMDSSHHQFGTPYWIDAEAPVLHGATSRYRRLAVALDTGGAIRGEVRADLYFGTGGAAGAEAGRVRHRLHLTRLIPIDPDQEDASGSTPPTPGRR